MYFYQYGLMDAVLALTIEISYSGGCVPVTYSHHCFFLVCLHFVKFLVRSYLLKDVPGSYCIILAPIPESAISPMNSNSSYWRMALKTKF